MEKQSEELKRVVQEMNKQAEAKKAAEKGLSEQREDKEDDSGYATGATEIQSRELSEDPGKSVIGKGGASNHGRGNKDTSPNKLSPPETRTVVIDDASFQKLQEEGKVKEAPAEGGDGGAAATTHDAPAPKEKSAAEKMKSEEKDKTAIVEEMIKEALTGKTSAPIAVTAAKAAAAKPKEGGAPPAKKSPPEDPDADTSPKNHKEHKHSRGLVTSIFGTGAPHVKKSLSSKSDKDSKHDAGEENDSSTAAHVGEHPHEHEHRKSAKERTSEDAPDHELKAHHPITPLQEEHVGGSRPPFERYL